MDSSLVAGVPTAGFSRSEYWCFHKCLRSQIIESKPEHLKAIQFYSG